jgi:hypothetical protein
MLSGLIALALASQSGPTAAARIGEADADRIVALATAGRRDLTRRILRGGREILVEDASGGRVASYRLDGRQIVTALRLNSEGCNPFRDRAALVAEAVRALDPGASQRRIRFVLGVLTQNWRPTGSHLSLRIGDYVVAGYRVGVTGCRHDHLSIELAGPRNLGLLRPPA